MSRGGLISWKEECDAIHREMDRLLTAGRLESTEERQGRKIQFMALIERRNVAAHNCLKSDRDPARVSISQQKPSKTPGVLPKAAVETMNVKESQEPPEADRGPQVPPTDPLSEVETMNVKESQEPPEADRGPQVPPADPLSEVETMSVKISQEPFEAALAMDRSPQEPPANPMFQVRNFLKFLTMK
jgi:hypothetical protein